jgi:hypothetical protein
LAEVVVLPVPFTPTIEITVTPAGARRRAGSLPARLFSTSRSAISMKSSPVRPCDSKDFRAAAMICAVVAVPRSAPRSAASSSSIESAVSRGERVTMRLIS